jgi:hypothetical protein
MRRRFAGRCVGHGRSDGPHSRNGPGVGERKPATLNLAPRSGCRERLATRCMPAARIRAGRATQSFWMRPWERRNVMHEVVTTPRRVESGTPESAMALADLCAV